MKNCEVEMEGDILTIKIGFNVYKQRIAVCATSTLLILAYFA